MVNTVNHFLIMLSDIKGRYKRALQNALEATGDFIGNKIANTILKVYSQTEEITQRLIHK